MGTQKLYKRIQMISNDAYDSFVVVAVEVFTYPWARMHWCNRPRPFLHQDSRKHVQNR